MKISSDLSPFKQLSLGKINLQNKPADSNKSAAVENLVSEGVSTLKQAKDNLEVLVNSPDSSGSGSSNEAASEVHAAAQSSVADLERFTELLAERIKNSPETALNAQAWVVKDKVAELLR